MKKLFWLCVAVLLIFSFTAGAFAAGREEETPAGKIPKRVGWCGNYMMHEWYQNVWKGMRERSEMLGIELEVVDSSQDMAKQVSLAEDLIAKGVDVLIVYPNYTRTSLFEKEINVGGARRPDHPYADPDRVAKVVVRAIESGRRELVLSGSGKLMWWLHGLAPGLLDRIMASIASRLRIEEADAHAH